MASTFVGFERILRLLVHDLAHTRIYRKINAYLFEGSVSLASWGCGQGFGDRQDLLRTLAMMNMNLISTHNSNS